MSDKLQDPRLVADLTDDVKEIFKTLRKQRGLYIKRLHEDAIMMELRRNTPNPYFIVPAKKNSTPTNVVVSKALAKSVAERAEKDGVSGRQWLTHVLTRYALYSESKINVTGALSDHTTDGKGDEVKTKMFHLAIEASMGLNEESRDRLLAFLNGSGGNFDGDDLTLGLKLGMLYDRNELNFISSIYRQIWAL